MNKKKDLNKHCTLREQTQLSFSDKKSWPSLDFKQNKSYNPSKSGKLSTDSVSNSNEKSKINSQAFAQNSDHLHGIYLKENKNEKQNNDVTMDGWTTVIKHKKKVLSKETSSTSQEKNNHSNAGIYGNALQNGKPKIIVKNLDAEGLNSNVSINLKQVDNVCDTSDEQRKINRELRKQRIKDEKKRKREEKARILRESLHKDTKISVISQELIDSLQKPLIHSQSQPTYFNSGIEDYPLLSSTYHKPTKTTNSFKSHVINNTNYEPKKSHEAELPNLSYRSAASTVLIPKKTSAETKELSNRQIPTKKKVKTSDGILLDFQALIEAKKKKQNTPKKKPVIRAKAPKRIETHKGKKREGKTKPLSSLRKNIIREKKRQAELLLFLLEERQKETESDKENDPSKIVDDTPERENSPVEVVAVVDASKKNIFSDKLSTVEACRSITQEIKVLMDPVHSRKFREYCHHVLTPEIDEVLQDLVQLLVKFQDRQYKSDPIKAKMKRRFYCGLKEALKHMNRLSCIVMAPNLKPSPGTGCVDELVGKVLSRAEEIGVPVIFGLSNRLLGRLCFRKVPVSCFAIVNYQGAQEKFHRLMELVPEAKKQYESLVASRPPEDVLDANEVLTTSDSAPEKPTDALTKEAQELLRKLKS